MSRRKDRERLEEMRRIDPDYKGFRGQENEPLTGPRGQLEAVTCTVCGHKRNVPAGIAPEQRETFVCASCQDPNAAEDEAQQTEVEEPSGV